MPSEALVHADEHGSSIDLLITDIVMPEMNGKVLVQQIAEQLPDLPVIYVSGFAEGKIAHDGDLLERSLFVAKPFSPEELLDAASSLLDDGGSGGGRERRWRSSTIECRLVA